MHHDHALKPKSTKASPGIYAGAVLQMDDITLLDSYADIYYELESSIEHITQQARGC